MLLRLPCACWGGWCKMGTSPCSELPAVPVTDGWCSDVTLGGNTSKILTSWVKGLYSNHQLPGALFHVLQT